MFKDLPKHCILMGKNHARVYSELPGAKLVGVADTNLAVAQEVASLFGGSAYIDYQELLESERPDAISIAVPTA